MSRLFIFVLTAATMSKSTTIVASIGTHLHHPTPPKFGVDLFFNQTAPLCTSRRNNNVSLNLRSGIRNNLKRWKQFIVQLDSKFNSNHRTAINDAMWTLQQVIPCVKFGIWSPESMPSGDYVYIITGENIGCSSGIGRRGGKQIMRLQSPGCMRSGTIMHEIIHALGFDHEHSRNDRDDHVSIHWTNIRPGKEQNFERLPSRLYSTFGVPYDTRSIMHYHANAFSKNGVSTITSKNGGQVGSEGFLQSSDRQKLKNMYGC